MKIDLYSIIVFTFLILVLAVFWSPVIVFAHGAEIEYKTSNSIEVIAKFDSGEPMAESQVLVYAPNNMTAPWLAGTCSSNGLFSFTPDASISGTWDIQVHQAGHGHMIHIEIKDNAIVSGSSSGYSTGQIIIMSVCVIWGVIGTALYFKRRKADARP